MDVAPWCYMWDRDGMGWVGRGKEYRASYGANNNRGTRGAVKWRIGLESIVFFY